MADRTAAVPGDIHTDTGTDELGYSAAMAELDRILVELDADDVDIDVLAARVARAAELVRHCRSRVASARLEIETVVAQLAESSSDPAVAGTADEATDEATDDTDLE